jgi:hypothetical protein
MLASFLGVLPILTPPLCALASIMASTTLCLSLALVMFTEKENFKTVNFDASFQADFLFKNYICMSHETFGRTLIACLYEYISCFEKQHYKQMLF